MSGLEFAAEVIGSLAWPIATLGIALALRRAITSALTGQLIKRWKAGPSGVEVEYWEQTVADARAELQQTETTRAGGAPELERELVEVAKVAPGAAVLEAYVRIESELQRLTADLGEDTGRKSGRQLADLAHRHGRINDETLNAVQGMSVLRNLAAHGHPGRDDLDTARALDYIALADAVLFALRNQPRKP